MVLRAFKTLTATGGIIDRVQNNIEIFANQFLDIPLIAGRLVENVTLGTSETLIEHKLGRAYRGFIIVKKNANQSAWVSSEDLNSRFLTLTASGAVTVSIWVF